MGAGLETTIEKAPSEIFLGQMGWDYKESGTDHVAIRECPYCKNDNSKFYMHVGDEKDGLFDCKVCGEKGNLYQLKEKLGLRNSNLVSTKDMGAASKTVPPLMNHKTAHWRLMNDANYGEVLDYLVAERGFTVDVLEKMMIGAEPAEGKPWIVFPYFDRQGNLVFTKQRSVPPGKKEFRSSPGREVPLYNGHILEPGMAELVLVEGEADTLALLSAGYSPVVGVPGANIKKAAWIDELDRCAPKQMYLLYDNDNVGMAAAKLMAARIGIEKVLCIRLPEFSKPDGTPGKDINDYFVAGNSLADFEALKAAAEPFEVQGVTSVHNALMELYEASLKGELQASLSTQFESLNKRVGGFEYGEVLGVLAEGKIGKTTFVQNLQQHWAEQGINNLAWCGEMTPKRLVRKWACMVTDTDTNDLKAEDITKAVSIADSMQGDFLMGYSKPILKEVLDMIRQAVRRYGVRIVSIDHLQLLAHDIRHQVQEIDNIVKEIKALAMELNIFIILIIQPNRVQDGEIVAARNANGSSGIEKLVDSMLCLHRNRVMKLRQKDFNGFMDTDDNFEPQLLVRADLTRYAAGGMCTLLMDGAKSKVRELSAVEAEQSQRTEFSSIKVEV